ncbi:MAG: methyltransferase domain-containing protein [Proteobacteria bacterium]|nr:methyltransferase domain-containing protein [Pseudomonadota bacterium]
MAALPQILSGDSEPGWWDEGLTHALLRTIPAATRVLLDYRCAAARAAHVLLPQLPQARYLGVDSDRRALREATTGLAGTRYAPRCSLLHAADSTLPLGPRTVDVVLSVMTLQHCRDPHALLREARRVLRGEGSLVAVEPDNLGQRFYFDGPLPEVDEAMLHLHRAAAVARQPADVALGPRLPALLHTFGFAAIGVRLHAIGTSRRESARAYCDRLLRLGDQAARAAGLEPTDSTVAACHAAVRRVLYLGMPQRVGFSAHLVPTFVCSGKQ